MEGTSCQISWEGSHRDPSGSWKEAQTLQIVSRGGRDANGMSGTTRRAKLYFRSYFDGRRQSAHRQTPGSAIRLMDRLRWSPQRPRWHQGREQGPEQSPGQAGTPGLQDSSYGCCQPDRLRHGPASALPAPPARPATNLRAPAVAPTRSGGHRPPASPAPQRQRPPPPGPGLPPSAADGTRRPPELTSGGRYGGLLAFPPRLRPFFFFVFEPPPPPGAAPPRPRSAALAPPPAGRQQPPNSSDTRESMADTAAPPPPAAPAPLPAWPRRPGSGPGVTDRRAAPRESESRPPTTPRTLRAPLARNYTSRRAPRRNQLAPVRVPPAGSDGS